MPERAVPVTLGSSWSRRIDVDGFRVTRVRFPPLLKLPLHTHERATVAVILNGSFDGLMRSASRPCPAASVLLEPFAPVLGEVGYTRDLVVAALGQRVAAELRAPDDVTPLAVEGLILEMLALTARLRSATEHAGVRPPPRWLAEARALLHDRRGEHLLVSDVADAVGVHPVHLARAFRLHYGTPVGTYLRSLRLAWAAARLTDSDDGIAQIALQAGFFDQSHFSRAFKRQFRLTPLAYRKAARR